MSGCARVRWSCVFRWYSARGEVIREDGWRGCGSGEETGSGKYVRESWRLEITRSFEGFLQVGKVCTGSGVGCCRSLATLMNHTQGQARSHCQVCTSKTLRSTLSKVCLCACAGETGKKISLGHPTAQGDAILCICLRVNRKRRRLRLSSAKDCDRC